MGSSCPRCGFPDPPSTDCPRCGVVFARLGGASPRPAEVPPGTRGAGPRLWVYGLLLLGALWGLFLFRVRPMSRRADAPAAISCTSPPVQRTATASAPPASPDAVEALALPPEVAPIGPAIPMPTPPLPALPRPGAFFIAPDDQALVTRAQQVISAQGTVDSSLLQQAEDLLTRRPELPPARYVVESLLELAARQADRQGRTVEAARYRTEAAERCPESTRAWLALVDGYARERAWPDDERAARRGLDARPEEAGLRWRLAVALMMQDRNEEAIDLLHRGGAADPVSRELLARLEREQSAGKGMSHQMGAHFHVYFEGPPDAAIGQAAVKVLEEKYAMLAGILGFEPPGDIPVLLYTDEKFQEVGAGPRWAGGTYSDFDGRIRIRTRGLSPSFVPLDLERLLTHELTHVFVGWRTQGRAPRDLNEGLAQYLSGARLGYRLKKSRLSGRGGAMAVNDFYDAALSYVEYLMDRYRQPTVNDLLEHLGETDMDQAYRRTFRVGYAEIREEWLRQLD